MTFEMEEIVNEQLYESIVKILTSTSTDEQYTNYNRWTFKQTHKEYLCVSMYDVGDNNIHVLKKDNISGSEIRPFVRECYFIDFMKLSKEDQDTLKNPDNEAITPFNMETSTEFRIYSLNDKQAYVYIDISS